MTKTEFHLREALEQIAHANAHLGELSKTYSKSKEKFAFRGDLMNIGTSVSRFLSNIEAAADSHNGLKGERIKRLIETTAQTRMLLKQARDLLGETRVKDLLGQPTLTMLEEALDWNAEDQPQKPTLSIVKEDRTHET